VFKSQALKLSCTLIVRNEAANLRACLLSIKPHVDELVVVDTGSTDETPAIAKEHADVFETFTGCNGPDGRIADFSAARNHALALATGDAVCWFDGDDVVRGGENLRKLVSEAYSATKGQPFAWLAPYEYERDAAGRVTVLQWRERLVYPRTGWEWRGPVHEGLLGKAGTVPTYAQTDLLTVQHESTGTKPRERDRNLRILEAYVRRVGETDQRMLHYFGTKLMLNQRFGEAAYWLKRHAQVAPWSDERCISLMMLGKLAFGFGDYGDVIDWCLKATATKVWAEPYWLMGMAYCELANRGVDVSDNFKRAGHFLQRGFELDKPGTESLLMRDPTMRFEAHGYYAPVLERLGRIEEAIKSAEAGVAGKPENTVLLEGLRGMRRTRLQAQIIEADQRGDIKHEQGVFMVKALRGELKVERAPMPMKSTVPALPKYVACGMPYFDPDMIAKITAESALPKGKLRIAFYLGHQLEPWTPETLEANGMGGSETMAWEMSKRLAKLGHDVTVFGHMPEVVGFPTGNYQGVKWLDANAFPEFACDVLIVSRQAAAVTLPHHAKVRVLWVHDVHCGPDFDFAVAAKFDWVWCLSNWHKEHFCSVYPWLAPGKVEVTRNGIDPDRFRQDKSVEQIKRNPHRAIYSSSPDRGLAAAVAAWPAVRAAIPDAELHCYYGFENWERSIELMGDSGHEHSGKAALERLKASLAKAEGVIMHGRVNQRELAEAMLGAGVWFYPTWFSETSCITAMEAQAAGLVCVCPPIAALAETVRRRLWDENDLVGVVRGAFFDFQRAGTVGTPGEVGECFSLDTLAAVWETRLLAAVERVVPAFHEAAQ